MHLDLTRGLELGKAFLSREDFTALFEPVLAEAGLHSVHDRSLDPSGNVAEMLLVFGIAEPVIGNAVASDISDAPVNDDDFPMIAIVHTADVPEPPGMVLLELSTSFLQLPAGLEVHSAATGCVDEEPYLDSLPSLLRESIDDGVRNLSLLPQVGLEVDR